MESNVDVRRTTMICREGTSMGLTMGEGFFIGIACFVLVFLLWWFRSKRKQIEDTTEVADGGDATSEETLEPKHKVFLSHSGAQKDFVEQLCVDLERLDRYPFFDKRRTSLPIGRDFPKLIFGAIEQCDVGVVVLSEDFFTQSKWPMLELVAMTKNFKLVIVPVCLGISMEYIRDPKHHKKWLSIWRGWAKKDEKRINIEEWNAALKALQSLNSLIYDGNGHVALRKQIVNAVCKIVLPLSKWKESDIQGRKRLAQVVCTRIEEASISKRYGIPVVGIYGVGGIGKTTICHILCNEYHSKMQGRVFHAELGNASNLKLLQGALRSLTDKSDEYVGGLNESKCEELLEGEVRKQPIFLAIDNVSNMTKFIHQAKIFLKARFAKGSIVVMTARSLGTLEMPHLGIDKSNCFEMPELHVDEAKALFMEYATCDEEIRLEIDKEVIGSCVQRCYFQKGDGKSHHYHPLALKVLGIQLGCTKYDREKWVLVLKGFDTFNWLREGEHPIFSILRKSFDILMSMEQMLFMDVAIFLPLYIKEKRTSLLHRSKLKMTSYEWLSMVHGRSVDFIMERLEGLKCKSLLEDLGDGDLTSIGMHDLWREFAIIESCAGEFEGRRWTCNEQKFITLGEGNPLGGYWQNMKRMCFLSQGLLNIRQVNFDHYLNITVLKMYSEINLQGGIVLNFIKLKYLKSLELVLPSCDDVEIVGLDSMKDLLFLQLEGVEFVTSTIGCLLNLRIIYLNKSLNDTQPDVKKLNSLEEVHFMEYSKLTFISGLDSTLSNLRILDLSFCSKLQKLDSSVGELFALEELFLSDCRSLEELPDLGKLKYLISLVIENCEKIEYVPGLDNLVSLKLFQASWCNKIIKLPDLRKLIHLEIFDITACKTIKSVQGLDELVALKEMWALWCSEITELPNLQKLTQLENLYVQGCKKIESMPSLDHLVALKRFFAPKSVAKLPTLQKLTRLESLQIKNNHKVEVVLGLDDLVSLKSLRASKCKNIVEFPNLQKLTQLEDFYIDQCRKLRSLAGFDNLVSLKKLVAYDCTEITKLPNLQNLTQLENLWIGRCSKLESLPGLDDLVALTWLNASHCLELQELPNLQKLTQLTRLDIGGCIKIKSVPGLDNLVALWSFDASNCTKISELPNLQKLIHLNYFDIKGCSKIKYLPGLDNLVALKNFEASNCTDLIELPNLQNLIHLEVLHIQGCNKIELVQGLDRLVALKDYKA